MVNNLYNDYSLDPQDYSSLVNIGGVVKSPFQETGWVVCSDEGVEIPVILHPQVEETLSNKNVFIDEGDEVEMLGTFIYDHQQLCVLALRWLVFTPVISSILVS